MSQLPLGQPPEFKPENCYNNTRVQELKKWVPFLQSKKLRKMVYSQMKEFYGQDDEFWILYKMIAVWSVNEEFIQFPNIDVLNPTFNQHWMSKYNIDVNKLMDELNISFDVNNTNFWQNVGLQYAYNKTSKLTRVWYDRMLYEKLWKYDSPFVIIPLKKVSKTKKIVQVCL